VILVGLLPCLERQSSTKEQFKKASNGLRGLSQKCDNCVLIPIAKSFINSGKIKEKYFRDGVHLTQMYSHIASASSLLLLES
jgi:hypothetical protein